jgi:2-keto-4-pentenoate hydratase/2-oxohepta-3-ene-1,7-dioic acid hydratase in catechol pathway
MQTPSNPAPVLVAGGGIGGQAAALALTRQGFAVKVQEQGELAMAVNGRPRQKSNFDEFIWNIRELIADPSLFYHLRPGDLILTGTPEGAGAVEPGAPLRGQVQGAGEISRHIGAAAGKGTRP